MSSSPLPKWNKKSDTHWVSKLTCQEPSFQLIFIAEVGISPLIHLLELSVGTQYDCKWMIFTSDESLNYPKAHLP